MAATTIISQPHLGVVTSIASLLHFQLGVLYMFPVLVEQLLNTSHSTEGDATTLASNLLQVSRILDGFGNLLGLIESRLIMVLMIAQGQGQL